MHCPAAIDASPRLSDSCRPSRPLHLCPPHLAVPAFFRIFVGDNKQQPSNRMNKFVMRLFLVAALLCGSLGSAVGARSQAPCAAGATTSEEQIAQPSGWLKPVAEEPQGLGGTSVRSVPSSQRIASSRPTRLRPTHGGKPSNHSGRWGKNESFNHPAIFALLSGRHGGLCVRAASPRLVYVIALRRLLC